MISPSMILPFLRHETVLLLVLVLEWLYFNSVGRALARSTTLFDILRHSVEIGLLALAMTPIILTGGIDLSVGSLLGLCAILFGKLWRDAGLPIPVAAACTLVHRRAGGRTECHADHLAAACRRSSSRSARIRFSAASPKPSRAARTRSRISPRRSCFSDRNAGSVCRRRRRSFCVVAVAIWLLVHRTTFGRSFRAIGFAPEGARYAGIPVERRLAMVYVLAGVVAALAAIIYTARLGQAKADAGTGYELVRHHRGGARRHEHLRRRRLGARHAARRRRDRGAEQRSCPRPPAARSRRHADGRVAPARVVER